MTTLRNKLVLLKEHAQYMQNMLDAGQTLMNLDHATLTNLFNDCQPAQKNSLDYAECEVKALRTQNAEKDETIAKLREALKEVTQLAPERAENMYKAQRVAFRILAETEQK